jgi:hypothetical protein
MIGVNSGSLLAGCQRLKPALRQVSLVLSEACPSVIKVTCLNLFVEDVSEYCVRMNTAVYLHAMNRCFGVYYQQSIITLSDTPYQSITKEPRRGPAVIA